MREQEFLTLREAAELLRFTETAPKAPEQACREWLNRHAIPVIRRGRVYLLERRVLMAWLESNKW